MAKKFTAKAVLEAEDRASGTIGKVEGRFKRLGSFLASRFVITLGDVTRAVRGVVDTFAGWIEAANKQEDAVKSLDAALAGLGPAADTVSESLQRQASALQDVTRYGDEAIIQAQAYLATLGVQADQIPQATQATLDLAAALGISLESAARNVGKTVGGFAGELGEVIPELKDLDTAALRAGDGITLLAEKFAGRAKADAETFGGTLDQLKNSFGDLQERLGESITKSEGARKALKSLKDLFADPAFVDSITNITEAVVTLVGYLGTAITKFNEFTTTIGQVLADWSGGLRNVEVNQTALEATAARLGITVGELKVRIAEQTAEQRRSNDETKTAVEQGTELVEVTSAQRDALEGNTQATTANTAAREAQIKSAAKEPEVFEEARVAVGQHAAAVEADRNELEAWVAYQQQLRDSIYATNAALDEQTAKLGGGGTSYGTQWGGVEKTTPFFGNDGSYGRSTNPTGRSTRNVQGRVNAT